MSCTDSIPGLEVYERLLKGARRCMWENVSECHVCSVLLRKNTASMCGRCQPSRKRPWGELQGLKALLAAMKEADQLDSFEDNSSSDRCSVPSPAHSSQNDKEDGTGFGGDSTDLKRLSRRHEILKAKKMHQTLVLPRYIEILSTLGFLHEYPSSPSLPLGHWAEFRRNFVPMIRNWLRSSFFDLVGDSCLQVDSKIRPILQIFTRWFQTALQGHRQESAMSSLIHLLLDPFESDKEPLQVASVLNMQVVVVLLARLYEQAQQYLQKVGSCKDKYDRQTLLAWDLSRLYSLCYKVLETRSIGPSWAKIKELAEASGKGRIELLPINNSLRTKTPALGMNNLRRARDGTFTSQIAAQSAERTYEQTMAAHRVTSVNRFRSHRFKYPMNILPATAMRRISAEFASLSNSLPLSEASSIFVSSDETRMDLLKFAIIGPPNTPYQNGFFVFDVMLPPSYPWRAPQACLVTTGHSTVRFSPNLYQDGYICLSLLGTWSGPGWDPQCSNLLQLCVSVQSLIFVSEPYFNEPGYDKLRSDPKSVQAARQYESRIRNATLRWAMLEHLRNPPEGFEDCANAHFRSKKEQIAKQLEEWESADYALSDKNDVIRCCDEVRRRLDIPLNRKRRRRH